MAETPILQLTVVSGQVNSLANNATSSLTLEVGNTYILYKIETNIPTWVKVYTSDTARTQDASRLITQDPLNDSGVLAETVTTNTSLYTLFIPGVSGICIDDNVTNSLFLSITNMSGITSNVLVNVTVLTLTRV